MSATLNDTQMPLKLKIKGHIIVQKMLEAWAFRVGAINPKLKPETVHPQPYTLNLQPQTPEQALNPTP